MEYYHGLMSRATAETELKGKPIGSFLLRKSKRNDENGSYAISVVSFGRILHYSIVKSDHTNLYSISHGSEHESPLLVCQHYMREGSGLKTKLTYPVICESNISSAASSQSYNSGSITGNYEDYDWFHGEITRDEDTRRLSNAYYLNKENGLFLVRKKSNLQYVLSLVYLEKVHRYLINYDSETNQFHLDERQKSLKFDSLEALIEFHKNNPSEITGLKCRLSSPCRRNGIFSSIGKNNGELERGSGAGNTNAAKSVKQAATNLAKELTAMLPLNSEDVDWSDVSNKNDNDTTSSLTRHSTLRRFNRKSMPKESIGYYSPYRNISVASNGLSSIVPDLYIDYKRLNIMELLGSGHFGSVRLAECKILGRNIPCAVKILSGNDIQANRKELLKEAEVMQHLDHPYIVRLLAVCDPKTVEGNLMIVLELAPLGTLKHFIKKHNVESFPEDKILMLMSQVCDGMAYLAHHNVVHRDLAARNILLVSENYVKISDFGMSRILHDSDYYKASTPGSWPLRWYAPEALLYYKFTSKGDVWSFAVTVWEVCSYGNRPYQRMSGRQVLQMLENQKRLECPAGCSPGLYSLLLQCWAYDPDKRPTFQELLFQLEKFTCD